MADTNDKKPTSAAQPIDAEVVKDEHVRTEPLRPTPPLVIPAAPAADDAFAPRDVAERHAEGARRRDDRDTGDTRAGSRGRRPPPRPSNKGALIAVIALIAVTVVGLVGGLVWWQFRSGDAAPAAGQAPVPAGWHAFATRECGGFACAFPAKPKHSSRPSTNTARTQHVFEFDNGQANYSIVTWDPPLPGRPIHLFQTLKVLREDFPLGQIQTERPVAVGCYRGIEVVIAFQDRSIVRRTYCANGRDFTLTVSAPRLDPIAGDVEAFLASFRPNDCDRPNEPGGARGGEGQQPSTNLQGNAPSEIVSLSFSDKGKSIVAATQNGELVVWDAEKNQLRNDSTPFARQPVRFLAFELSPDGQYATASSLGGHFYLTSLEPFRDTALLIERLPDGVTWTAAYSPDGRHVASGHDHGAKLWHVAERRLVAELAHADRANALAFSPSGKLLAVGTKNSNITLWEVDSQKLSQTLQGKKGGVPSAAAIWALAWSPDGKTLAAGGNDRTVRLWDVDTTTERALLKHDDTVRSAAISPDGRFLATGDDAGAVAIWDVKSGSRKALLPATSAAYSARAVAFSPDSTRLFVSWGSEVRLWRLAELRWEDGN